MIARNQAGYTILEMIIVMPIIALISGAMFSIMFDRYGDMLINTAEANLRLEAQTMLLNLEDELLFTTDYGTSTAIELSDPYAPSGGWSYDPNVDGDNDPATGIDNLIIYETALDSDRRDPDRNFIRRRNYNCNSANAGYNPIAINNLVYFSEDNPDNDYRTLYKRTIVPQYSICSIDRNDGDHCVPETATCRGNFKEMSCPEANVGTGSCERSDAQLTEKLVDFQIVYFDEDNIETSDPANGEKVEVTATLGEQTYGKDITVTSKFIIKKIN